MRLQTFESITGYSHSSNKKCDLLKNYIELTIDELMKTNKKELCFNTPLSDFQKGVITPFLQVHYPDFYTAFLVHERNPIKAIRFS